MLFTMRAWNVFKMMLIACMQVMFMVLLLTTMPVGTSVKKLPRDVIPREYIVRIITDLDSFAFSGHVTIQVECIKRVNKITLHMSNLYIAETGIAVLREGKGSNLFSSLQTIPENEFLVLKLTEYLLKGKTYTVYISFQAELKFEWDGYYRSFYFVNNTNKKRWYAITHFEATKARSAFPCFDEPELKARFLMVLGRHNRYRSVSNMPLNFSEPMHDKKDWIWDHYQISVPMPTYLVAFKVSDFDMKSFPHPYIRINIWTPSGKTNMTKFSGELTSKLIDYFENYFYTAYTLPKMDMVAVPYFHMGAMENWGLLIFRDDHIYNDPPSAAGSMVIAHELAHQWLGNLVSIKWWDDLWLKEGFATYLQIRSVHELYPDWNVPLMITLDSFREAMRTDALTSATPLSIQVKDSKEIINMYTRAVYQKAFLVIRMLGHILGGKVVRAALRKYIKRFQFGNANRDDLWSCFLEVIPNRNVLPENIELNEMMNTWVLQPGFPLITVSRQYENHSASIIQERCMAYEVDNKGSSCWIFPLTYTSAQESESKNVVWMDCEESSVLIQGLPGGDHWLLFNIERGGYVRVNYDERNWNLIIEMLNSKNYYKIPLINRAQLVEDACVLADYGYLHYNITFRLLDYLEQETETIVFHHIATWRDTVSKLLKGTTGHILFHRFSRKISSYQQKNKTNTKGRRINQSDVLQQIRSYFSKWMLDPNPDHHNPIPMDLRPAIYCAVIRRGNKKENKFLRDRYLSNRDPAIFISLSCATKEKFLRRYLEWALHENGTLTKPEQTTVLINVARNEEGIAITQEMVFFNSTLLFQVFAGSPKNLGVFLTEVARSLHTEGQLLQILTVAWPDSGYKLDIMKVLHIFILTRTLSLMFEAFLDNNSEKLYHVKTVAQNALDTVKFNIRWYKERYHELITTLNKRQNNF